MIFASIKNRVEKFANSIYYFVSLQRETKKNI